MRLSSLLKVSSRLESKRVLQFVRRCWRQIMSDSVSPEYGRWRYHFIIKRLYLMTWVAIVVAFVGHIVNWIVPLTSLDLSGAKHDFYQQNFELINRIQVIGWVEILFTFVLLRIPYVRKYPIIVLLWLTWTLLISDQVLRAIFLGLFTLDGYGWVLVLSAGPILMPVKWRSHFICQLAVLIHFAITHLVFGINDPFADGVEYFNAIYVSVIVCSIANYAMFLYEKFLQQEFELKRQLQLFLHTVSHDLRNPVLGNMFLLKSLHNSNARETTVSNEILRQMIDSGDRQLQLIDSLLEAHNTETKGIAIYPRQTCMNHLVQSVITDMQPFLDRQQAIVTKKIPAEFPLVDIDPLQIRRVYKNLIANALEYNQPGLHLTLKVEQDTSLPHSRHTVESDRWIYCTVTDNGQGIPSVQHSQLFDLYTRAATNKQSLNLGLGLYICRQIINAHGGEIGINSNLQGASFWFTLPINTEINNLY